MALIIGVLALQGGFSEHLSLLRRAAATLSSAPSSKWHGLDAPAFIEVRNADELSRCSALIIPGGESTTIALIAVQSGIMEPLRNFVNVSRKPVWGTCAGLILLAEEANSTKKGGQELIGGLDVRVQRNHFGRQIESFVADMNLPFLAALQKDGSDGEVAPFPGVFIRAPIVEELLNEKEREGKIEAGHAGKQRVEVMAVLPGRTTRAKVSPADDTSDRLESGHVNDIVAVRQGNVFGTSFHPELTNDTRIHEWWLERVLEHSVDMSFAK